MHRRLVELFLLLFLAAIGVNWPELPYSARLAELIFLPLAVLVLTLPQTRWQWRWSDLAIAVYLLGTLPSIVISSDPRQSAIEMVRQLYLVALYVVFAIAARQGFARTSGQGLALGGAVLSIVGLVFVARQLLGASPSPSMGEVMPLPYLGSTLRLRALTASEAMLACVLTAAGPFAIGLCRSDRVRLWCGAAMLMTVAAVLTFSHALAGFVVAMCIAVWPWLSGWPRVRRLAIAGVVLIVLGLNVAATVSIKSMTYQGGRYVDASPFHHAVDEGETRIGGTTITYSVMSYARIKQVAWRAFVDHPIAGIGLDNFHAATRRAHAEGSLPSLYQEIDPHSTLLGRLAETGIIGGVTLLVLWAAWAGLAREVSFDHPAIGYAAAAALAGLIVSSLNADIMNFRFVWVLAGLMRGLQEANGIDTASGRAVAASDGTR